ncbi:hypothetical protein I3760_01G224400 [Carya illinoinensis]|nr:hypothetical protein I3760_01G224400 [Carya illinoinensis]
MRKNLSTGKEKKETIAVNQSTSINVVSQAPSVQRKRKRTSFNNVDGSVGPKKKHGRKDLNNLHQRVESMNLITQLPVHIIHYILSLLRNTKDAARTSILSKRWRELWTSFSILKFDQHKIQKEGNLDLKNENFKDFVDNSLKRHLEQKLSICKLVLRITSYDLDLALHMDQWVNLAVENHLKELDLHFFIEKNIHYTLPQSVFAAKTLTGLRLYGCKLKSCGYIKLPHLQKLYMRQVVIDQQTIRNMISGCPLVEDLRFIHCTGLKDLQVSGLLKLDRFEMHHFHGTRKVEITAPNLLTFWYCGNISTRCEIDLVACASLKRLTLEDAYMTDEVFQDRFASFPVLEKLELSKCHQLMNITISSIRLKQLVLRGCKNLMGTDIDTPNLFSFEYKGNKMPFDFTNPLCLKQAKLSFERVGVQRASLEFQLGISDAIWFDRLRQFLKKLKHSNGLKLVVRCKKNIIIHEELREILLPPVCDIKLEIVKPSTRFEDLLDQLLRTWHPETLSIVSSSNSNLPKLAYQKMKYRQKNPSCCTYNTRSNRCWRHFLKDVKYEGPANRRRTSSWMSWLSSERKSLRKNTWLDSPPTVRYQTTTLALFWKS